MATSRLTDSLLEKDIFTAYFLLTICFYYVTMRYTKRGAIKVGWPSWEVLYIMSDGVQVGPSLFIFKAMGMG